MPGDPALPLGPLGARVPRASVTPSARTLPARGTASPTPDPRLPAFGRCPGSGASAASRRSSGSAWCSSWRWLAVGPGAARWRQAARARAGPGDRPADRLRRRPRRGLPGPARPGARAPSTAPSSPQPCAATCRRSPTRRGCGRSRWTSAAAARTPARWAREAGEVAAADAGEPVTLFVHVVDCRGRAASEASSARLRLLGRARRPPLPPVLGLLPGQPELGGAPGGCRFPPGRLGVLPDPDRRRRRRRQGQLPPRLQLRRRLELVAVRRRDRQARRLGPASGALLRLRRQPRRPRLRAAGCAPPLDARPPRPPDPGRGRSPAAAGARPTSRSRRRGSSGSTGTPSTRDRLTLQIALGDHPALQRALDQRHALLVLRQVADAELLEQRPQVGLDGVDPEVELLADLAVGGGVANEAPSLYGRQRATSTRFWAGETPPASSRSAEIAVDSPRPRRPGRGRAQRAAEAQHVAVAKAACGRAPARR